MAKKQTEYKYPKNWFKHNLIPVPTGLAGGNCRKCIFRNYLPQYCNRLACAYVDMSPNSDYIESVYWTSRETRENPENWSELHDFFTRLPKQRIRDISNDIMRKAVISKLSEKSM